MIVLGPCPCRGCGVSVFWDGWHWRNVGDQSNVHTCWGRSARARRSRVTTLNHERFEVDSRARARDNDADEYSVDIAHNAQRPADRLYSGQWGVDVPEYRRNG